MNKKYLSIIAPLTFLTAMVVFWEYGPYWFEIPNYILPRLSAVLTIYSDPNALVLYARNGLVTLQQAAAGLVLGASLGFLSAIILSESRLLMVTFYPYIVALQCMPKIALAPLLVIWFGFGMTSKIVIVALLCYFPLLVNTLSGLRGVSTEHIELFKAMRASRLQRLLHLSIPAALPSIMTGLELAILVSLLGAIVGEFVGGEMGLGVLLLQAQFQMNIAGVFAVLGILGLLGVAFNLTIRFVRRRSLFWIAGETGKNK